MLGMDPTVALTVDNLLDTFSFLVTGYANQERQNR